MNTTTSMEQRSPDMIVVGGRSNMVSSSTSGSTWHYSSRPPHTSHYSQHPPHHLSSSNEGNGSRSMNMTSATSLAPPTSTTTTTATPQMNTSTISSVSEPPPTSTNITNAPTPATLSVEQMSDIRTPHAHDVLCGRGGSSNRHIGNTNFRDLVQCNKALYVTLTKRQKMMVARSIVQAVRNQNPPGRFLQKDNVTGLWFDIGRPRALEKTSQALREKPSGSSSNNNNNSSTMLSRSSSLASSSSDHEGTKHQNKEGPQEKQEDGKVKEKTTSTAPKKASKARSSSLDSGASTDEVPPITIPAHLPQFRIPSNSVATSPSLTTPTLPPLSTLSAGNDLNLISKGTMMAQHDSRPTIVKGNSSSSSLPSSIPVSSQPQSHLQPQQQQQQQQQQQSAYQSRYVPRDSSQYSNQHHHPNQHSYERQGIVTRPPMSRTLGPHYPPRDMESSSYSRDYAPPPSSRPPPGATHIVVVRTQQGPPPHYSSHSRPPQSQSQPQAQPPTGPPHRHSSSPKYLPPPQHPPQYHPITRMEQRHPSQYSHPKQLNSSGGSSRGNGYEMYPSRRYSGEYNPPPRPYPSQQQPQAMSRVPQVSMSLSSCSSSSEQHPPLTQDPSRDPIQRNPSSSHSNGDYHHPNHQIPPPRDYGPNYSYQVPSSRIISPEDPPMVMKLQNGNGMRGGMIIRKRPYPSPPQPPVLSENPNHSSQYLSHSHSIPPPPPKRRYSPSQSYLYSSDTPPPPQPHVPHVLPSSSINVPKDFQPPHPTPAQPSLTITTAKDWEREPNHNQNAPNEVSIASSSSSLTDATVITTVEGEHDALQELPSSSSAPPQSLSLSSMGGLGGGLAALSKAASLIE